MILSVSGIFKASSHHRATWIKTLMSLRGNPLTAWLNRGPLIARSLAMLAVAAGVGMWGALLLAPQPSPPPPSLIASTAPGPDISPLVQWMGGGSARLRVAVVGLISIGERGTALLSINGGPPLAYSVGHSLAHGVTLTAVMPHAVSIDQDGIIEDVTVAEPVAPVQGFVPAEPPRHAGD
jgi:general secretion pathway protein C